MCNKCFSKRLCIVESKKKIFGKRGKNETKNVTILSDCANKILCFRLWLHATPELRPGEGRPGRCRPPSPPPQSQVVTSRFYSAVAKISYNSIILLYLIVEVENLFCVWLRPCLMLNIFYGVDCVYYANKVRSQGRDARPCFAPLPPPYAAQPLQTGPKKNLCICLYSNMY